METAYNTENIVLAEPSLKGNIVPDAKGLRILRRSLGERFLTYFPGILFVHHLYTELQLKSYLQKRASTSQCSSYYHPVQVILRALYPWTPAIDHLSISEFTMPERSNHGIF